MLFGRNLWAMRARIVATMKIVRMLQKNVASDSDSD
jgi:hypothetical protein